MTIHCGGYFSSRRIRCQLSLDVAWEILADQNLLSRMLTDGGWVLSVTTAPGQGETTPVVVAPLCPSCTKKIYGLDFYQEVQARRTQVS